MEESDQNSVLNADTPRLIPNAGDLGVLQSLLLLFSKPRVFFASLPKEDSPKNAIGFLIVMAIIGSICRTAIGLFVVKHGLLGKGPIFIIVAIVVGSVITAVIRIASGLVGAVILKLLALCFKIPVRFQDFLRVVAYSSAALCIDCIDSIPVPLVPSLYGLFLSLYSLFLLFSGLLKTLQLSISQVTKLVIWPIILSVVIGIIAGFLHGR